MFWRQLLICFLFLLPCYICGQVRTVTSNEQDALTKSSPLFPDIYYSDTINEIKLKEAGEPYWVHTQDELNALLQFNSGNTSLLLNNDILAFYGHPNSRNMGILGRYSIEELDKKLTEVAKEYEAISGGRKIIKAFYLIYGTVWPQGEIGILRDDILKRYIEYALENDILIFIDHQIGRYDPIDSLKRMLPWLKYPNVHLALDPEWRTSRPMLEIGSLSAEELNTAQRVMEEFMIENQIRGGGI